MLSLRLMIVATAYVKNMFLENAAVHRESEYSRAAVPSLFMCKYHTEAVDSYTINMDPPKGGRCFKSCLGGRKVTGSNVKKQC